MRRRFREIEITTLQRRRRSEIEQIVAGFAESSLHRTEFCRCNGLSLPRAEHQTRGGDERHLLLDPLGIDSFCFTLWCL
jgi:hypothetical protein